MGLERFISREDQYEVAKAKAELAYMAFVITRFTEPIIDLFFDRLRKIHAAE